jgi:hypothetical protein
MPVRCHGFQVFFFALHIYKKEHVNFLKFQHTTIQQGKEQSRFFIFINLCKRADYNSSKNVFPLFSYQIIIAYIFSSVWHTPDWIEYWLNWILHGNQDFVAIFYMDRNENILKPFKYQDPLDVMILLNPPYKTGKIDETFLCWLKITTVLLSMFLDLIQEYYCTHLRDLNFIHYFIEKSVHR